MIERNFCDDCGQERMVYDGLCCDCRDYVKSRDKSFLSMFLFVVIAGAVILALVASSQVYFD